MSTVPTLKLSNGNEIPALGFGVFQMSNEEAEQSVLEALAAGYRLIDTAASYGNEEAVGRAIKKSGVPREEIFVTTKLWLPDVSYEKAKPSVQRSLDKLDLDYVDLYLIHQPYNDVFGAWRALEELYDEGKLKAIGISNFSPVQTVDLYLNARIKPMVNQIETHPFLQQAETHKLMAEYDIVHEGWAPFAEGRHDIFSNDVLTAIAKDHDKTVGQIIVRWNIQRGVVAIPKSVKKERIIENFSVFDFALSDEEMAQIATLEQGLKTVDHNDPEFLKYLYNRKLS